MAPMNTLASELAHLTLRLVIKVTGKQSLVYCYTKASTNLGFIGLKSGNLTNCWFATGWLSIFTEALIG
ncbi:hypothetical protein Lepto7375DRAFT_2883 [Leptolyngbya sp. PCC 7375]|nr:hypothetical protein Lepto7375DRAFT_2883 [Leptolyngbya sp. PCC 7375]